MTTSSYTVTQMLEKTSEYKLLLYMAFVDYEKAFGSIKHKTIFEALEKQGVRQKCLNILKQAYKNGTAQIQTELLSNKINIQRV